MRAYDLPPSWVGMAMSQRTYTAVAHPDDLPGRVARVDTGVVTVLAAEGPVRASWGAASWL